MTNALESAVACWAPLAAPVLTLDEAEATAVLFKALADPARVRIVNALATRAARWAALSTPVRSALE